MNTPKFSRSVLAGSLLVLAGLFALWFRHDKHIVASLLVFVLPPLLACAALGLGARRAPFWAGVLALSWFCHGVMVAWSRPDEAIYAWTEIVLSLLVVLTSTWPALLARFGKRS